jgi:hypothetical protein
VAGGDLHKLKRMRRINFLGIRSPKELKKSQVCFWPLHGTIRKNKNSISPFSSLSILSCFPLMLRGRKCQNIKIILTP